MKRLFSFIISFALLVSIMAYVFSPVSFAAGGALVSLAGEQLGPYIGQLVAQGGFAEGYVASNFGSAANWLGTTSLNFSIEGNSFTPTLSPTLDMRNGVYNYSPTTNKYYSYDGSGATYNYQYNSNDYRSYQVFNTENKTIYNPVTNTYNNYNNYYYNQEYDLFYFEGDTYNTYYTTNVTYVSYYVSDNVNNTSYYYQIYFQLPDGRNSWDLKAEDVWGTYFIYDVVNYDSVLEDDGTTLGLYHFDTNLNNSAAVKDEVSSFNNISNSFVDGYL